MRNKYKLEGCSILLAEDDAMQAIDLFDTLADEGAKAVVLVSELDEGLRMTEGHRFDAAILDYRLGGKRATPLANYLDYIGTPFIVQYGLRTQGCVSRPLAWLAADPETLGPGKACPYTCRADSLAAHGQGRRRGGDAWRLIRRGSSPTGRVLPLEICARDRAFVTGPAKSACAKRLFHSQKKAPSGAGLKFRVVNAGGGEKWR